MSERRLYDEALAEYIASGTSWTPLFQLRLFETQIDLPEFEGRPNRSRKLFVERDMLAAAMYLRHIFVPNHEPKENDALVEATLWVQRNPEKFFHDGYMTRKERFRNDFPPFVGANHQSVAIILGGRVMFDIQNNSAEELVTFTPNTEDWEKDLYSNSFIELKRLLDEPYKFGKKISKNIYSTSRQNNVLLSFFWSGGRKDREEGIDTFTWRMLTRYYQVLLQREILQTK